MDIGAAADGDGLGVFHAGIIGIAPQQSLDQLGIPGDAVDGGHVRVAGDRDAIARESGLTGLLAGFLRGTDGEPHVKFGGKAGLCEGEKRKIQGKGAGLGILLGDAEGLAAIVPKGEEGV